MSKYNLTGLVLENKLQLAEGTRAMVAFLGKDGIMRTTYNHYDGYYDGYYGGYYGGFYLLYIIYYIMILLFIK